MFNNIFEKYRAASKKAEEDKMDPVKDSEAKKKFDDRDDKDIDNDGDVDSSDKFLHKRRKAIAKSKKADEPKGGEDTAVMNPKKEDKVSKEEADPDTVRMMKANPKMQKTGGPGGMKGLNKKAQKDTKAALKKESVEVAEKFDRKNKASIHIPMGADGIDKGEHKQIKKDVAKVGAKVKFHSNGDLSYHGSDHALSGALKQHHPDDKEMADLNHHKSGKSDHTYKKEEVSVRDKLMSIWEKAEDHTKGATKPETMDDKLKGKGAKDMANQPKEIDNTDEKGHDDAAKAGRTGPKAKARNSGDNTTSGDRNIVNKIAAAYKGMKNGS